MKNKKALYSIVAVALTLILGVTLLATKGPSLRSVGSFTLRVNPELNISYNKDGNVIKVEAKNEDGQKILDTCKNVKGLSCEDAVQTLLNSIYSNGYFENTIDGNQRNIVLILEPNSKIPNEHFIETLRDGAKKTGEALSLRANVVDIDSKDFAPQTAKNESATTVCLTAEKAKSIALAQAGVDSTKATFTSCELDRESGILLYDLEFVADGIKYEYDIDAMNGKVLKAEHATIAHKEPIAPQKPTLSLNDAKAIALKHAGVAAENAKFYEKECELDREDGQYEIEFTDGKFVYSFEIHAVTGAILESEQKSAAYVAAEKAEDRKDFDDDLDDFDDDLEDDFDDRFDD